TRALSELHQLLAEVRTLQHADESCGCVAQAFGHALPVLDCALSHQLGELTDRAHVQVLAIGDDETANIDPIDEHGPYHLHTVRLGGGVVREQPRYGHARET